jgi:chemotaxis protein CheX
MDVRFVNPFVAAIKNVFSTMVGVEVTIGKPHVRTEEFRSADVSGIIGLSGDATGAIVLSFPRVVACKVASMFAGAELGPEHEDFTDAIGELANMIAGNAKKDFGGLAVSISLPSVIVGAGHQVCQLKDSPQLVIPCQTPMGPFNVEVAMLAPKKGAAPPETEAVGAAT